MAEENLGEIYVKIRADVSNLNREVAQLKAKLGQESTEMGKKLSFKAKFDNSVAVWRISELQKLREKLQKEFDKKVSINVSSSSLERTREKLAAVDSRLKGVGDSAQKTAGVFSTAFARGLIAVGGITAIFGALRHALQEARDSAIAHAQVAQAVRRTGMAAGLTANELFGLAQELKKLTAIDDDTILTNVTNNLLTFRNVAGDVFKRAQLAVLDLNAVIAKGEVGSLTAQTIQLGKALQSPTTGLMYLTRAGISFNEEQKKQIKLLSETGRLYEAQSLILDEIERQYGGQAKILALADGGFKKLNQTIDDVSEALGDDLVGGANEGTGALQELGDAFLEVNEGVKAVNQGVGIFGFLMDGLKNVVTGGRGVVDFWFNRKEIFKAAKEQHIKNLQEIEKRNKEFYKALGLNVEPPKLTPLTPILDTTAGDEILNQYAEQQSAIYQIRNKLKDVNITTEQRVALEKELNSLLGKDKTVTTKFVSQIPKSYTAEQVAEYEKLKFAAKGYADYALAVIQLKYNNELAAAKGNTQEILKAEEEKTLAITKLKLEAFDYDRAIGNRIVEESVKNTEILNKESDKSISDYKEKQKLKEEAIDKFYSGLQTKDRNYFIFQAAKIKEEAAEFLKLTGNKELAKQMEVDKLKALDQEYLDWQIESNKTIQASFDVMRDVSMRAFDEIRIRASSNASAIENMFIDMGNIVLNKLKEIAAEWAAMSFLRLIFGVATGGAAAAVPTPAGHSGGNFIGTSNGVKKLAGGGSFIVPPGFPNDSYPLLVESGERVTVNPASNVGMQDRLLRSIDKKLAILNSNTLEWQLTKPKQQAIPLYGKLEGNDIYLSNKRTAKKIGRMF